MGCYLEYYWAWVGTWAVRFSWQSAVGHIGTKGGKIYMGPTILCTAILATSLMIGGVELKPGPVENIVQVLCSDCDRNVISGS